MNAIRKSRSPMNALCLSVSSSEIPHELLHSRWGRLNHFLCMGIIVLFATAFSGAVGSDQRNFFVIGIMGTACLFYVLTIYKIQLREVYGWLLLLAILLCFSTSPESFRWSSFFYSAMFILTFLYYMRMLYSGILSGRTYQLILQCIIYAYFGTLLLQQFCVLMHWPIFNFILGEPEIFKLNSLSPEPSHSARILVIAMYAYVIMREIDLQHHYRLFQDGFTDRNLWFCFLYTMLTMGSGTAYFLLPLFLLRFISFWLILWGGIAIALCVWLELPAQLNVSAWTRVQLFSQAVLTGEPAEMLFADHSASVRVLPIYYYGSFAIPSSPEFWFGYGMSFNEVFSELIPGVPQGLGLGGIFPSFLLNQGVIAGCFLLLFIAKFCLSHLFSFATLLTMIMIFSCGLNTQIPWLIFLLLGTNKYFINRAWIVPEFRMREKRCPAM